jgi:phospholipid transport system substrate-binding protein
MKTYIQRSVIKRVTALVLIAATLFIQQAYAENGDPDNLIRSTSQDILQIIKSDTTGDNRKVRDQVETRVMPLADFNRMTAFAVGRPWRTATPEQKAALIKEFRALLARTYLSALTIYKSASLSFKPARYSDNGEYATVRVEVSTKANAKPIPLDFSLEKTAHGWKVYDVAVEGISFMTNHRNQFAPIIASQGIDGLIKQLTERNNSNNAPTNVASGK